MDPAGDEEDQEHESWGLAGRAISRLQAAAAPRTDLHGARSDAQDRASDGRPSIGTGRGRLRKEMKMLPEPDAETREQLIEIREEKIKTIQDLNLRKQELRRALNKIVQLEATIRELEAKIQQLESKIRSLEARISELEAEVAELKRTVQERDETIAERDTEIETLKKEIEKLKGKDGPIERVWTSRIDSEQKGPIVSVDNEWNFVVFKVTDKFIDEIAAIMEKLDEAQPIPNIQFVVRRGRDSGPGSFVTKIRFKQLRKDEKLCVADILTNWLQRPVQKGDVVWYD